MTGTTLREGESSHTCRKRIARPNPSLHPTAYSGLRPLPSAGDLKR